MRRVGLCISVIALFLLTVTGSTAIAAGNLSLQPLRQELELQPGQTATSKVTVTNSTDSPQTVIMSAATFNVTNENYDYSFNEAEQTVKWVSFSEPSVQIAPRASHAFSYTIGVPGTAEPGERDLAVFASVSLPSGGVDVVNRVGELTYLTVAGNVTRTGGVLSLRTPLFSFRPSVAWETRLLDTGTAHYKSVLTVTTSSIFGRQVSQSADEHLLLPNAPRMLRGNTTVGGWPGIYKMRFTIGQGDAPAYQKTKWVLYMPVWAIVVLVMVMIFVLPELRKIRRIRHRSKSH